MISLTLFGLAISWLVFLRKYPWLFARPRMRSIPRYHYQVGGPGNLPTWKRKVPAMTQKSSRTR